MFEEISEKVWENFLENLRNIYTRDIPSRREKSSAKATRTKTNVYIYRKIFFPSKSFIEE